MTSRWKSVSIIAGQESGPDNTPDAVDWTNIVAEEQPSGTTNTQTISGIDGIITLDVSYTQIDNQYTLEAFVNGSLAAGPTNSPGTITFDVISGDTVYFRATVGNDARADADTVTITNTSDNNTVIDTFLVEIDNRA